MTQLPAPLRAVLGLVATVVQDSHEISDKTVEMSVQAISTALQLSLRAQQHYAALTVRGDELLAQWRGGPPEDAPEWAHFDDEPPPAAEPPAEPPAGPPAGPSAEPPTKTTAKTTAPKAAKRTKATKPTPTPARRNAKASAFDRTADDGEWPDLPIATPNGTSSTDVGGHTG